MRIDRSTMHHVLVLFACAACTPSNEGADRVGVVRDDAAATTVAEARPMVVDSAARMARQQRLRTLQATTDDLAARDSVDIRVEVDITARRVRVLDARSDTLAQHGIAVGSADWPTRAGQWTISQVVLNPEWIPPTEESWAKDEKASEPGDPQNPLGVAQLVYDLPRSIHGTNAPKSIGKAVSHGSVRATNASITALAALLLERTGVEQSPSIMQEAQRNRTIKRVIDLPRHVPIRVY